MFKSTIKLLINQMNDLIGGVTIKVKPQKYFFGILAQIFKILKMPMWVLGCLYCGFCSTLGVYDLD